MKIEIRQVPGLQQLLAPQLIQSLKMLQMPILQLEQTLRMELTSNPLLEEVDELDEVQEQTLEAPEPEIVQSKEEEDAVKEKVDWDSYLYDEEEGYRVREIKEPEEERFEGVSRQVESLYQHLLEQLNFLRLSDEDRLIGEYILGNINTDGYLAINVPEMAAELKIDAEKIEKILAIIQKFDPTGVGSRDLRESLMIQLREKGQENTLAYRIVDEHIKDLEKKSILQIAKFMGVPFEKAQKALEVIKGLSPTPAHGRFDNGAMPVVPDLVVERYGDEYAVFHNDRNVPRLRINTGYKDLIKRGNSTAKDTKDYVRQKLEQARWLLNAINQRRSTMIRVMEAIIEEQQEFFEKGPAFLKPLIMDDIARKVDMNVATISRVSSGKYVQTPLGVYEIKHFFNAGLANEDGEDLSKRSIKQRIEEIIKAENADNPLSDQEIFKALKDEKIKLARRTVTKYREELGIKPARFRKRFN
jgi:RNA polymerase sigma-54 factor